MLLDLDGLAILAGRLDVEVIDIVVVDDVSNLLLLGILVGYLRLHAVAVVDVGCSIWLVRIVYLGSQVLGRFMLLKKLARSDLLLRILVVCVLLIHHNWCLIFDLSHLTIVLRALTSYSSLLLNLRSRLEGRSKLIKTLAHGFSACR